MHVLDLFSGIGGLALGFQRAGMRTAAFCEADPFARRVLRRHWPDVPCYGRVEDVSARRLQADGVPAPGRADVLAGEAAADEAGRGAGLDGARSGLWRHMLRLVEECRPAWVVAENVPALRVRGADRVLAGLEAAGYACWPLVVGAAHAGAPHRRQRVFILAHAGGAGLEVPLGQPAHPAALLPPGGCGGWPADPGLGGMADGLPTGLDRERRPRLKALGNAVAPDVATAVGQAVMAAEAAVQAAAERTRSANALRNLATLGPTTARQ